VRSSTDLQAPFDTVIITVSDRCAAGERKDLTGPLIARLLTEAAIPAGPPRIVPDGAVGVTAAIAAALAEGPRLVITTGGTGVSPRDQTPEGTLPLLRTQLPGIMERIRAKGAESAPTSVLSRGLAGIADSAGNTGALVVNLPGSSAGVRDGITVIQAIARHVIEQLDGGAHP
jgi:molybdenum cofactor synthesis domain-containing protein